MASFVLPIISGLAGLFGGGKQQQTSGTSSTSGQQNVSSNGQTAPNLSPAQQQLASLFTTQAKQFGSTAPDLTGYTQGGLETINNQNAGAAAATKNMLAARGLGFSPAAATTQTIQDQGRQSQIMQFLSQIPLLQRALQQQGIQTEEGAFSTVPVGQTSSGGSTTTSSGETNQTGTVSGNPLAGLFSGVGSALAAPSAVPVGNGNTVPSNLQSILKSLGF